MVKAKKIVTDLLASAKVTVGGSNPGDIQVKDERFYSQVLTGGSLALGESYMAGWWEAEQLDVFFSKILAVRLDSKVRLNWSLVSSYLANVLFNRQSPARAFIVGEQHYDAGNDLYRKMLDKRMVYTCAYWPTAKDLDEAQEQKLDLTCRKLGLKPGMKVLDIGCGWGSFAKFAAEKYGVSVVGVTVSKEQVALAQELCAGLPVEIRLQDYRDIQGEFDAIVSLGMFEHVGDKNYRTYFEVAKRCLKDDGLFLLHTIGKSVASRITDPWINKYIFPNGVLPSVKQIATGIEGIFVMEDWHNFGPDYDKTLMAWHDNFVAHWPELKGNYSEQFYRMWRYYLLSCAGAFRSRQIQLWQIVLSKNGVSGGYCSIR
jgi:cyclopropane-fatty-acyl-phospholipid synthase